MRLLLLLLLAVLAWGQGCPEWSGADKPDRGYQLEGRIGSSTVRMHLEREGNNVSGAMYFLSDWVPIAFAGCVGQHGRMRMSEVEPGTRKLAAQLTGNHLTGTWDGKQQIDLHTVSFTDCLGHEPWKRFDDPRWPVTFSYPASWHVAWNEYGLELICANPGPMLYDGDGVSMTLVKEPRAGVFVQCSGRWYYGNTCECDQLDHCRDPEIAKHNTMTVLIGDRHEWRRYRRGVGYVGQTEGYDRLILSGSQPVHVLGMGEPAEIIERLVETIRPRTLRKNTAPRARGSKPSP